VHYLFKRQIMLVGKCIKEDGLQEKKKGGGILSWPCISKFGKYCFKQTARNLFNVVRVV